MDLAPINIDIIDDGSYDLSCSMPNFGSQNFNIISRGGNLFLQYDNYPLVNISVGFDLLAGTNCPYEIKIIPTYTSGDIITPNNVNQFYIGMIEK